MALLIVLGISTPFAFFHAKSSVLLGAGAKAQAAEKKPNRDATLSSPACIRSARARFRSHFRKEERDSASRSVR